ncbi:MAG: hypothetical protein ABIW84_02315 [Ilumatobacteraceae bacterium]
MPVATFLVTVAVTATVSTAYALYTTRHGRREDSEFVKRVNQYTNAK